MSGYTPVFNAVFTGTLCGKYPDTAAWLFLLALADWRGHVDVTPQYIASVTGMPVAVLLECVGRFLEPDTGSRTQENEGRRLELLEPETRQWGWRIVNFVRYRERARELNRVESGTAAEKQRRYRARKKGNALPVVTRRDPSYPDSDSDSDSNTDTEKSRARAGKARSATHLPETWELTDERRRVATTEGLDPERTFAKFRNFWLSASGQRARKRNWDAAWRYWCQNDRGGGKANGSTTARVERKTGAELEAEARARGEDPWAIP